MLRHTFMISTKPRELLEISELPFDELSFDGLSLSGLTRLMNERKTSTCISVAYEDTVHHFQKHVKSIKSTPNRSK